MEFDLFTFIAQVLNFLLLVFLLYKFLFGRVKAAMDEREKRISRNIEEAEKKKAEAEELEIKNREINKKINEEKEEMLNKTRLEAGELKEKLLSEARIAYESESKKLKGLLESQKEKFYKELLIKSRDFVFALAEKILKELADEELEEKIAEKFISRIKELDKEKTNLYGEIIRRPEKTIIIKSSFEIPEKVKNKVIEALKDKFQFNGALKFENNPDGSCGIELELESYKISWNIERYLSGIEERIFPLFNIKETK